jgi:hypothetical protein
VTLIMLSVCKRTKRVRVDPGMIIPARPGILRFRISAVTTVSIEQEAYCRRYVKDTHVWKYSEPSHTLKMVQGTVERKHTCGTCRPKPQITHPIIDESDNVTSLFEDEEDVYSCEICGNITSSVIHTKESTPKLVAMRINVPCMICTDCYGTCIGCGKQTLHDLTYLCDSCREPAGHT